MSELFRKYGKHSLSRRSVLQCIPSLTGGGAERQLTYLCSGLAQSGWDVTVVVVDLGVNLKRLKSTGVRVEVVKHKSNYDPRIVLQIIKLIRRLRPGIVHTWLPMMDALGGIAAAICGVSLVGSERNSRLGYPDHWKFRLRSFVFSSCATAVVANSNAGLSYLQSNVQDHVAKYVVPNGLPIEEIDASLPASHKAMGLKGEEEVILFAGRFDAQKNLPVLFQALPLVFKMRPQAVAILCGDGPLRKYWLDWTQQHNLNTKILLPGYVDNLWSWMKNSDVFVFPSQHEGQSNAVIEAMACHCPLIVSDIPEHHEFLENNSALLVPPSDAGKVTEAILETLTDRQAAASRAANARDKIAKYSVEEMVRSYEDIYLRIIDSTARSSDLARAS